MAQKKLNPKQGIQPIFICPKINNRHRRGEKRVDFWRNSTFLPAENTCEKPLQATA